MWESCWECGGAGCRWCTECDGSLFCGCNECTDWDWHLEDEAEEAGMCGNCCDRCGEGFEGIKWRVDDGVVCTDCWERESSRGFWAFVKSDGHKRARRRERAFYAMRKALPQAPVTVRRQLAIWYNVNFVPVPYRLVSERERIVNQTIAEEQK